MKKVKEKSDRNRSRSGSRSRSRSRSKSKDKSNNNNNSGKTPTVNFSKSSGKWKWKNKKKKDKKKIKEVAELSKKMDVTKDTAVDAHSATAALDAIISHVDVVASNPGNTFIPIEQAMVADLAWAFIHYLSLNTPIFTMDDDTAVSPKDIWVYLHLSFASLCGKFTARAGASAGQLPAFETFKLPAGWLRMMNHFQPVQCNGTTFKFVFPLDLTTVIGLSTLLTGQQNIGVFPFPLAYDLLSYDNTIKIGTRRFENYNIPITTWIQTRLPLVISALEQSGVTLLDGGKLCGLAPDASALAYRVTGGSNLIAHPCTPYDEELAQIFSVGRIGSNSLPIAATTPRLLGYTDVALMPRPFPGITVEQQMACTMAMIMFHQKDYSPLSFRTAKIGKVDFPRYRMANQRAAGDAFLKVVFAMYAGARNINPSFDDSSVSTGTTSGPFAGFLVLYWTMHILLLRRINLIQPQPYLAVRDINIITRYWPQGYYTPNFSGVVVPPAVADFISSFGICRLGDLVTSQFLDISPTANADTNGLALMSSRGTSNFKLGEVGRGNFFPFSTNSYVGAFPNLVMGDTKFDATYDTNYLNVSGANGFACVIPWPVLDSLKPLITEVYKTVGNIVGNMVPINDLECVFGKCYQSLAIVGRSEPNDINQIIIGPVGPVSAVNKCKKIYDDDDDGSTVGSNITGNIGISTGDLRVLSSLVPQNCSEIAKTFAFNSRTQGQDIPIMAFRNLTGPGKDAQGFVRVAMAECFTPNIQGGVPEFHHNAFVPGTVGKIKIEDNHVGQIYERCVAGEAQRALSDIVTDPVCSVLVNGVELLPLGNYLMLLNGPLKKLCKKGLGKVVCAIAGKHNVVTSDSSITPSNPGSMADHFEKSLTAMGTVAGVPPSGISGLIKMVLKNLHPISFLKNLM
jgi:hypothetical protein